MTITFSNDSWQKFSTTINEINYDFTASYNSTYGFWTLNVETDDFIVNGINLVCGIDIFRAFPELPFSGICNNPEDPNRDNINLYELEIL